MPLQTFDFHNHTPTTTYPKGDGFKFGGGYEFAAKPQLPLQRRFRLHFSGVVWYVNTNGTIDYVTDPANNAGRLMQFYEDHLSYEPFLYTHPVYGTVTVRFAPDVPLEIPKSQPGGSGMTDSFEVTLVEQPL